MSDQSFRIFPIGKRWGWSARDAGGRPVGEGLANTRAEAAALVIRSIVRATTAEMRDPGQAAPARPRVAA